jgi:serine/threonine-protein kinase
MTDEPKLERIGDYEILGTLGAGGMGKVYKVRNTISDRIEAMKVLLPDLASQSALADRFRREIKLVASLDHPNIAALRTALVVDNQLLMIMEYVPGITLAARLQDGPIPAPALFKYMDGVLAALSYAHARQIIHRDIKPANMMLTPEGNVKLMDFGIARSGPDSNLTTAGNAVGSVNYMSPEQVRSENVDARSDIYSLGVSMYELVTGRRPFESDSDFAILSGHVQQAPRPPFELRPDMPPGLNDIILMCLAKDPAARFQTAAALRHALDSVRRAGSDQTAPLNTPAAAALASPVQSPAPNPPASGVLNLPLQVGSSTSAPAPRASSVLQLVPAASATSATPLPPAPPAGVPSYVPPAAAVPADAGSKRGLYIGLGAAIVLVALAAAGFSAPHWMKTRASDSGKSALPAAASNPETPATSAVATPPPSATAPAETPAITIPQAASSPAAPAHELPGALSIPANPPSGAAPRPSVSPGSSNATPATAPSRASSKTAAARAAAAAQAAAAATATTTAPPAAPATPPPPAVDAAQLDQLEHQGDQLSSRAVAVKSSLDAMRSQMSAQGVGLRGDIVAAEDRMFTDISKGQAALQSQDTARAKTFFDQAETELSKIERFLGR